MFLWQDWTLLAEFVRGSPTGSYSLRRAYLWGLDVDGSLGGAGGVGGLLWVADYAPGQSASHRQLAPWYDGNGNVMGWMENDSTQTLPLYRLEYDPYGKLLVEETVRVVRNKKQRDLGVTEEWLSRPPFAFSTKYEDAETGLLYYGYRYYSPEMGRWISRDPIGERGGINLYGMVGNDPVNKWDYLGREAILATAPTEKRESQTQQLYFFIVNRKAFDDINLNDTLDKLKNSGVPAADQHLQNHGIGGFMGPPGENREECAAGAQCLTGTHGKRKFLRKGAYYDAPKVSTWRKGAKVLGNNRLRVGTLIGTFRSGSDFFPSQDQHALVYLGQDSNYVYVLEQFHGRPMGSAMHGFGDKLNPRTQNVLSQNPDFYFVVLSCDKHDSTPSHNQ